MVCNPNASKQPHLHKQKIVNNEVFVMVCTEKHTQTMESQSEQLDF